jgi:hypothetical protein
MISPVQLCDVATSVEGEVSWACAAAGIASSRQGAAAPARSRIRDMEDTFDQPDA